MNTPVNFEIAKLLKEKGYSEPTIAYRQKSAVKGDETILPLSVPNHEFCWTPVDWNNYSKQVPYYSMPTIAEVIMWLYEKHGVWLHATMSFKEFSPYIQCDWNYRQDNIKDVLEFMKQMYNSPAEAYTAAIGYTLTKLI